MEISHRKKFLFIHIPKTAGTSIAQILAPHADTLPPTPVRTLSHALKLNERPNRTWFEQHDTAEIVCNRWGKDFFSKYYSFSFVRNPYDHAISHYNFTKRMPFGWTRKKTIENLNFEQYLEWRLLAQRHQKMERRTRFVCMPDQSFYLCDDAGNVLVEDVFKVENLPVSISKICRKLNIESPVSIPHEREQKGKSRQEEYLNERSINLIQRLYERDFQNFSYQKLL